MTDLQTIFDNGTHQIKIPSGASTKPPKDLIERDWRDDELRRTDKLMILEDYPHKGSLKVYRQKLRDYPNTEDFPHGERPTE